MIGKRWFAWLAAAALASGFAACGDDGASTVCDPGVETYCTCPGTSIAGTHLCKDDGQSFEECISDGAPCSELDPSGPGSGSGGSAQQTDCRPGLEIVCRCENGDDGTQVCNDEGDGFGDCETEDGPCGAGVTTGGGGGSAGLALYHPCGADAECESGSCPMGFCTQGCGSIDDCGGEVEATCARFQGSVQICAPACNLTAECEEAYGEPSTCGYGIDPSDPGFYITVCGDWLDELQPLPPGIACETDEQCNLGNLGLESVCDVDECVEGCFVDSDCPVADDCDSDGVFPGSCL